MIGIGTCGPAAYAVWLLLGELKMQQEAKRYRAMRWLAQAELSNDKDMRKIISSVPQYEDMEFGDSPTEQQLDEAFDRVVAHLEANGVDLSA